MWDERIIQAIASHQYGLIRRSDAFRAGVTDREIQQRVANGRAEQVHPGVYYLNSTTATWKTDVLAAVMAAGPDALASHRCAAVLLGLDGVHGRVIELTVPYAESPQPSDVILHRTRRPNTTSVVDHIPATSVEKTLLDLARMLPDRTLEKAARSAIRLGLTTVEKLDLTVATYGGRGVSGHEEDAARNQDCGGR